MHLGQVAPQKVEPNHEQGLRNKQVVKDQYDWTEEEETLFYKSVKQHGRDWVKLSDICGRTVTGVKSFSDRVKKQTYEHQIFMNCDCEREVCKYAKFLEVYETQTSD